jgi:hypothetical protein
VKLEELSVGIRGEILDFKQMEQTVWKWEQKQRAILSRIDRLDEKRRKN